MAGLDANSREVAATVVANLKLLPLGIPPRERGGGCQLVGYLRLEGGAVDCDIQSVVVLRLQRLGAVCRDVFGSEPFDIHHVTESAGGRLYLK